MVDGEGGGHSFVLLYSGHFVPLPFVTAFVENI